MRFQFHIGAIKMLMLYNDGGTLNAFQFHIGAIKMIISGWRGTEGQLVSIPYWCD